VSAFFARPGHRRVDEVDFTYTFPDVLVPTTRFKALLAAEVTQVSRLVPRTALNNRGYSHCTGSYIRLITEQLPPLSVLKTGHDTLLHATPPRRTSNERQPYWLHQENPPRAFVFPCTGAYSLPIAFLPITSSCRKHVANLCGTRIISNIM
jgi:hypothetical protein